jgi:RIO kinase 1
VSDHVSDQPFFDPPTAYDPDDFADYAPFVEPDYSSWDIATHGPEPYPDWVITNLAAIDTELGILKTGKEADVHLVSRTAPDGRETVMAAKRYRTADHRLFHRDASYTEGRRVKKSRERRALARRTDFGRELAAGQWAVAEFGALAMLWEHGAPVPYPIQLSGTELMLEFIGTPDGGAAPRLAQVRPSREELPDLFEQCVDAMRLLARAGYAHGDLSPFNVLVHEGRIVLIDLPQIVDLVANPLGAEFLHRDCENICNWFARRGLETVEFDHLFGDLVAEAFG